VKKCPLQLHGHKRKRAPKHQGCGKGLGKKKRHLSQQFRMLTDFFLFFDELLDKRWAPRRSFGRRERTTELA